MEKLSKEEVRHVAHLARIYLSEEEIEKYRITLAKLYEAIDKIHEVKGYNDEIMISPVDEVARLRKDEVGVMLERKEALSNAPKTNGKFIEVPVMISE